ncbi:MAG: DnaJ domain-containing protein [Alphaproteobacteria bacterium]|jgi:hypothetical protein|nr:DnaJ domain-containing protein [Alphaproteobacteria bacterium]
MPSARDRDQAFRLEPIFDLGPDGKTAVRRCDHAGCTEAGEYRAPKSRHALTDYFWFCLDHVRDYNRSWNYYAGMDDDEVETMVRQDTIWQRRTWPFGSWKEREARLRDELEREFGLGGTGQGDDKGPGEREARRPFRPKTEEEKALATLELEPPVDFPTIKGQYKTLVKRHHPDANGGDRAAEERLKTITHAYAVLRAAYRS